MSKYPRASDLPWGTLAVLVVTTIGLHVLGGFIDWLARPAPRSPAPPPVTIPARPPSLPPRIEPERPRLPPLPPHSTREELVALVRFLQGGGTLPPEHVRELNNKGVYIRGSGAGTVVKTAPGYLPQAAPAQRSESAWDKFRNRNMAACGKMTCP